MSLFLETDLVAYGRWPVATDQLETQADEDAHSVSDRSWGLTALRPQEPRMYGGNFPWVNAQYRLKVDGGFSPYQWLNGLASRLLSMQDIIFKADGSFCRPDDPSPLFPLKGLTLHWRYDVSRRRMYIDFWRGSELLPWRWDELEASEELRFPSVVPDWRGIGHAGSKTFTYTFLSAEAKDD
eukprot:TRINITY_DN10954_c0_g1_i1.p1 TRINITY_DN10954_c0_g1~~TRINITY_DN10954_c0_g1_i1.p1  ORF type:complete len:182 (-),score=27.35 TRINITY_DN10954_c0_g1_i1:280-825(-)